MAPRKKKGKKIGEARDLSQSVGRLAAINIKFLEVSMVDHSNPAVAVGKLHEFTDMLQRAADSIKQTVRISTWLHMVWDGACLTCT
ncbi:hypothetical protein SRHO_G00112720 [Serrasalmus rhombeus]